MAAQLTNRVLHNRRASDRTCIKRFMLWTHYHPAISFVLVLLIGASLGGAMAATGELWHGLLHTVLYR